MFHLKKFIDSSAYRDYLASDDQWRPSVSYIVNEHVENIDPTTGRDLNMSVDDWSRGAAAITQDASRYVDFQALKQHFIEVFNQGTMYFWDMKQAKRTLAGGSEESLGDFYAEIDSDGTLNINVPQNTSTADGSAWYTLDSSTGELNFWNFPETAPGTYTWIDENGKVQTKTVS